MNHDNIEIQCWICPLCHNDHKEDSPCSLQDHRDFMPSDDDTSMIAMKYRELFAENQRLRDRSAESCPACSSMKKLLDFKDNCLDKNKKLYDDITRKALLLCHQNGNLLIKNHDLRRALKFYADKNNHYHHAYDCDVDIAKNALDTNGE